MKKLKKRYIYPLIGAVTFFGVTLILGQELAFAVFMGAAAYGAGVLITIGTEIEKKNKLVMFANNQKQSLYDTLKEAKDMTSQIGKLSKQLEDAKLVENVNEICITSNRIIDALSKNPNKLAQANNFLKYYLPVTIKILNRYDEIENQRLNSKESQKFMKSVQDMTEKIKEAFKEQLNNMYQTEIIDTDAEIKVFESMLKSDGFIDEIDFNIEKDKGAK